MEDATLYHGTFDTTGVNPGSHADVTKITDTNFKEVGKNPAGIADWEDKFQLVLQARREKLAKERANDLHS